MIKTISRLLQSIACLWLAVGFALPLHGGVIINSYMFSSGGGGSTDPHFANVVLLLHFNGSNGSTTFTDNSPAARTVTAAGGAQISSAQSYFGGASGVFDGSGDYLSSADSSAFHMTGDFTLEFFIRPTSTTGFRDIFAQRTSNIVCPFAIAQNGSVIEVYVSNNNSGWAGAPAISSGSLTVNVWYYVALVRNGSAWKLYINGSQSGSTHTNGSALTDMSSVLNIGGQNSSFQFAGYMDELRWTTVARDVSTIPTAAFPDS